MVRRQPEIEAESVAARLLHINEIRRQGIEVGEVRVPVEMRNGIDAGRFAAGEIPRELIRTVTESGVVDTGAVSMTVPRRVADALGLPTRRRKTVRLADGTTREVDVVGPITFVIEGRAAEYSAHVVGDEVLVGQIALEEADLLVDCTNQRLVPNPAHPNGPETRI